MPPSVNQQFEVRTFEITLGDYDLITKWAASSNLQKPLFFYWSTCPAYVVFSGKRDVAAGVVIPNDESKSFGIEAIRNSHFLFQREFAKAAEEFLIREIRGIAEVRGLEFTGVIAPQKSI